MKLLFVSNGNGEIAIADRIAEDVRRLAPDAQIDHLALVGISAGRAMREVGPRRLMPSGGLIAMGNLGNIARDVGGGLLGLTLAQRRFLVRARGSYDGAIAVGDVYALLMTLAAHAPTVYVGTAKSVLVAPYGPMERRVLRRARAIFVRDALTAERLQAQGVDARAPGNVIVDLFAGADDPRAAAAAATFEQTLAVFPGSRENAYDDAAFLFSVVRAAAQQLPSLGALVSIAPLLDAARFAQVARERGFAVETHADECMPFTARLGERVVMRAWRGPMGALLPHVRLVIGQAGTANEAAAAAGVPVVAFELGRDRKTAWYRTRQHGLLADALAVVPGDVEIASREVVALLADEPRRARMGAIGRERMGAPGGAAAIARAIVELAR